MRKRLDNTWGGWLTVFRFRFVLTPITIDWMQYLGEPGTKPIEWRALYVFGVRIARWRVFTP